MQNQRKVFSVWLDAIRGLAALVVFLGHARVVLIKSIAVAVGQTDMAAQSVPIDQVGDRTGFGHVAVIVFFVLSGYLVGGSAVRALRRGQWSASNYSIARISRLWTVLVPVLLLGYILDHLGVALAQPGSIYSAPPGQRMVFADLPQMMTFSNLVLNLFFLQGIVTNPFGTNNPLWTLSYEFWFYAAFPFLMFLMWSKTRVLSRFGCLVVLLMIGFLVGPKICLYFCFWLFGVLLEFIPKRLPTKVAWIASISGSALFVGLLIALIKAGLPIAIADAIESVAFTVLCYPIIHLQQPSRGGVVAVAASGLSAMSYTLYLAHAPVIAFIDNLLMPVWRPWPVDAAGLGKFSAVSLGVFLIAVLLYWLFERRTPEVRFWISSHYDRIKSLGMPAEKKL